MSVNQRPWGEASFGLLATTGTSSQTLNAAATWLAMGFLLDSGKTLSKVRIRCSALSGSISAGNVTCSVYADSAGAPTGAALSTSSTYTGLAASTTTEFTGFSQALTAHTQFWLVFKNLQGTPASNFPTFQFGSSNSMPFMGFASSGGTGGGWCRKTSSDSGSTWAGTATSSCHGLRLEHTDGSFDGFYVNSSGGGAFTVLVYSARESGVLFTMPPNTWLNLRRVTFWAAKSGTPTGNMRVRVYRGKNLIATSQTIPAAQCSTNGLSLLFYFAQDVLLEPNVAYRVTLGETTQSDTSSNTLSHSYYVIDNNADLFSLLPFGGTWTATYYDGSTWTTDQTTMIIMGLHGDTSLPFAAPIGPPRYRPRGTF